jgi:hypothetical protein
MSSKHIEGNPVYHGKNFYNSPVKQNFQSLITNYLTTTTTTTKTMSTTVPEPTTDKQKTHGNTNLNNSYCHIN